MTDYNAAAEAARGLAKQFRAVLIIGDALAELANFQNMRGELEAAKNSAEADLATVKSEIERESARLADTQASVTDSVVEAEATLSDGNAKAKKAIAEASHEAHEIRDNANKYAADLIAACGKEKTEHSEFMAAALAERGVLEQEIAAMREELAAFRNRFKL